MAAITAEGRRAALWAAVLCAWSAALCCAAPPRWQPPGTEASAATDAWADEFDLDGDKEWLGDAPISPSSIPQQSEYEDYDDDDNEEEEDDSRHQQSMDLEEEDHQDDSEPHQAEFLFVPPSSRDNRLMLQDDDDDQSGPIKVRHTGKNPYPEVMDGSDGDGHDSSSQFEFTIDNGDEDDKDNEVDDDDTNDFVLDDAPPPRSKDTKARDDDEDDENDDDDNFVSDGDSNNDPMFETPEEDSQVIYGDHVFLY